MPGSVGTCLHMDIFTCTQTHSHNKIINLGWFILIYICLCFSVIIHYSIPDFFFGITFVLLKCTSFFTCTFLQEDVCLFEPVLSGLTEKVFTLSLNNSSAVNFPHYTGSTILISCSFVAAQIIPLWTISLLRNPF